MLRERKKKNLNSHSCDFFYLQLRSIHIYTSLGELTTIHVTYIKKGKTVHYIYIIFNKEVNPNYSNINMNDSTNISVNQLMIMSGKTVCFSQKDKCSVARVDAATTHLYLPF